MTPATPRHCAHECVCSKYIDHTNTGATKGRICNGETWCFKPCPHDTRTYPAAQAPPASSEPMYLISESKLLEWVLQDKITKGEANDIRARGPVVAQQAPAAGREKHLLYLNKSTPEEFINAELMDWVYLIGDISTQYELDFVRQFGHALKIRQSALLAQEREKWERERAQQELQPSFDDIDELNRKVGFYQKRMDMLQCWQSSMRDPERKIVCDILANGFTLTTKEEIDNALQRKLSAIEDITPEGAAIIQRAKAQAREDVLDKLTRFLDEDTLNRRTSPDRDNIPKSYLRSEIESLRSEVGK